MLERIREIINPPADASLAEIEYNPEGVYVLQTPYKRGSKELQGVMLQVNQALEKQNMGHVPVIVMPCDMRLKLLDDKQLQSIGLFRRHR